MTGNGPVSNFLDGVEERVEVTTGEPWSPGLLYQGNTEDAGMARHDGGLIPAEEYEERLDAHKDEHGPVEGIETIILNVVETSSESFEQEIRNPQQPRYEHRPEPK